MGHKTKTTLHIFTITVTPILFIFILIPCPVTALVGDTDSFLGLDGSFRTFVASVHNYNVPLYSGLGNQTDDYLQAILRLTSSGNPFKNLSYEVHLVQTFTHSSAPHAYGIGNMDFGVRKKTRYRALDDVWHWLDKNRTTASLWMDRFNLKCSLSKADITIGRQAITFGKAYFWNPLDVFLPFDPAQFDRDYKPGVDALRLDVSTGDFSGFTLIGALGRKIEPSGGYEYDEKEWSTSWYGSSVLGRFFTHISGWDVSIQGGKVYGGYQLGGGMVGEINGLGIRGEAAYFWAEESPSMPTPLSGDIFEDHFTGVIGCGYRFQNSLNIEFEYLYNGGGESNEPYTSLPRLESGAITHLGRHLTGLMCSYEFTPLAIGQFACIYGICDSSAQIQPSLTLSLTDDAELLMGTTINVGQHPSTDPFQNIEIKSEFGTYPNLYFVEFKIYF